jgi:hypothetical protein
MTTLGEQSRQQRIALLVILAFGSVMLWQTYYGSLLLYPFTILATWFHEMGHALAAVASGSQFDRLLIFADGSGVAITLRPIGGSRLVDAFIAAGGPLGAPLAGAGLILASRRVSTTRNALAVLGIVLIASSLVWVRSFVGLTVLPLIGVTVLLIAWRSSAEAQQFTIQLIGVQACISIWRQTGYLFSQGGVVGGLTQRSDTQAIADLLGLSYWFWGLVISALIAALLWWSFRRALR